ncbi:hypothetical protein KCH_12920 [Kitasatospora cheerisanensis KCTC 2395]|uniref:Uncharacterized protein n=1 Tax=Kitasatospora cheerisanensis KCTC 2395 TaxID=1348663 RepID=A0A066Z945_9ACTN|nr:hypothetical protein KCH_12920 [Kitasatospora cheerisanensis KCTC 2395]
MSNGMLDPHRPAHRGRRCRHGGRTARRGRPGRGVPGPHRPWRVRAEVVLPGVRHRAAAPDRGGPGLPDFDDPRFLWPEQLVEDGPAARSAT